jgi:hypothetical protein
VLRPRRELPLACTPDLNRIPAQIQSEDVCVGALQTQGPIIAHSLRSIALSRRSSSLLCSKIFGLCPYPAVPHYTFPMPKPTRNVSVPWSGRRPPLRFVHVTDIHVDQYYEVRVLWTIFAWVCSVRTGRHRSQMRRSDMLPRSHRRHGPAGSRSCAFAPSRRVTLTIGQFGNYHVRLVVVYAI